MGRGLSKGHTLHLKPVEGMGQKGFNGEGKPLNGKGKNNNGNSCLAHEKGEHTNGLLILHNARHPVARLFK